jgi:hypothetical protein
MNNQRQENPERDPDGHWRQGHSGNPRGRPKGARHRATILAEQLMQGDELLLSAQAERTNRRSRPEGGD